MTTFERIQKVIAEETGMDIDSITPESTYNDIGIDSLDEIEIIIGIEDEFNFVIDDDMEAASVKSISGLISLVEKRLA